MELSRGQLETISRQREEHYVRRLDALLLPFSAAYATHPPERRCEMLARVAAIARGHGIEEELNVGLFCLLALLWGLPSLKQPAAEEILGDARRNSSSKIFQLWELYRRANPRADVFGKA